LVYGEQKRWDEQLQMSHAAIKINQIEFPAAYYCAAEATFHNGKLDDAEHFTRQALQVDPSHPYLESLVLLGQIFEKQGNPSDALTEYKNYLGLSPHGPKAEEAKEGFARLKETR
jgi:tetratricopeptide (TPR) repeat protein